MSILFILLALAGFGFVIAIHEFGHFIFAKWAGVRVEVFSIGFGPRLITRKFGETEYSLSLLPLGGYVRMTGQEDLPQNTETTSRDPASFLSASAWWRAAILLGGVLFNFISSYLLLLCLAVYGLPIISSTVGEVRPQVLTLSEQAVPSPAARLGLRPGDRVVEVNGVVVRGFEDMTMEVLMHPNAPIAMTVERPGVGRLVLAGDGAVRPMYDAMLGLHTIGLEPARGTLIADAIGGPDAPRQGERLVAIDGVAVASGTSGQDLEQILLPRFGQRVDLTLRDRAGVERTVSDTWAGAGADDTALGLPVMIGGFSLNSQAQAAGVRAGDVVLAVDGVAVAGASHLQSLVRRALAVGRPAALTLLRDGAQVTAQVPGIEVAGRLRLGVDLRSLGGGIVPHLPAGLDGQSGPLAKAGVKPGEAIVAVDDRRDAAGMPTTRSLTLVGPGERLLVPVLADTRRSGLRSTRPGKLAGAFGARVVPSLYERLIGSRIEGNQDSTGKPTGSPVPGSIVVKRADGTPDTIDLTPLGKDGTLLLATVRPGDWITADTVTPEGLPALEILRGAPAATRTVALERARVGLAVVFDIEETSWTLQGPGEAFAIANRAAHTMIYKSLTFIPRFFKSAEQGGIDSGKQLQGPIGIFRALKNNAERFGFDSFLKLVAFIGLNLVLVNLLPIPITDGGQLVFLAIEGIIRRPVPVVVRNIAAWIGLALVVGLMLYVTSLDIMRLI